MMELECGHEFLFLGGGYGSVKMAAMAQNGFREIC